MDIGEIEASIFRQKSNFSYLKEYVERELTSINSYFSYQFASVLGLIINSNIVDLFIKTKVNCLLLQINVTELLKEDKSNLLDLFPKTRDFEINPRIADGTTLLIKKECFNPEITLTFKSVYVKHLIKLNKTEFTTKFLYYDPHILLSDHQMKTSNSGSISFGSWNTMNRISARSIESGDYSSINGSTRSHDVLRYNKIVQTIFDQNMYVRGPLDIICVQECMKGIYDIVMETYINPSIQVNFVEYDNLVENDCNMGGLMTLVLSPYLNVITSIPIFTYWINSKGEHKKKPVGLKTILFDTRQSKKISVINVHLPCKYSKVDLNVIIRNMTITKDQEISYEWIIGDFNLKYEYLLQKFTELTNISNEYIFIEKTSRDVDHGFLFTRV